ncbi:MAG TPA: septal ring lytic transglycosylase RlpA family protein [Burkholderiaceae bacterium]|nr:septal ring lytic transglycosylase RlpA family protein [Burkholderiaceae bacterium]
MPRGARRWSVVALLCLMTACGTTPKKSVYYQDDGPPDRVPADLGGVADAVPKVEPAHKAASRPYTALGRTYTPLTGDPAFKQRGLASWYGKQFHGSRTANGETYDMFAMTAAHPTLPIPSYVRVTSVRNGRSVIVRVNDRGPFKADRVIDLSYAAASRLGIAAAGTGEVEIERITMAQIASGDWRRGDGARGETATAAAPPPVASAVVATSATSTNAAATVGSAVPSTMIVPVIAEAGAVAAAIPSVPAPNAPASAVSPSPAGVRGWSVQLGAFAQEANAEALAGRVSALLAFSDVPGDDVASRLTRIEKEGSIYRVLVGNGDRAGAQSLARELERLLDRPTAVVQR